MVLDSQGNVSLDLTKLYASLESKIAANPEMGMHAAFEAYAYMKEAFATIDLCEVSELVKLCA